MRLSTPQKKIDEKAFPVRLLVKVPENGFGRMIYDIQTRLDSHVGRGT